MCPGYMGPIQPHGTYLSFGQFYYITVFCLGDAIVDEEIIHWEHRKRFEGLCREEIAALSLNEYDKKLEQNPMEFNT